MLPSNEKFTQLVESARSYIQSSGSHPSSSVASQSIFLKDSERDGSCCSYCREATGRKYRYRVDHCRRKAATGEFANGDTQAAKRPRILCIWLVLESVPLVPCTRRMRRPLESSAVLRES